MNDMMSFRPARISDIASVANLFIDTLPEALPVKLGRTFLANFFLPVFLPDDDTPLFVISTGEEIVGFALFAVPEKSFVKKIQRLKFKVLKFALLRGWRYPLLLPNLLLSGIFNMTRYHVEKSQVKHANYLVYMAMAKTHQGQGLGSQFLRYCFDKSDCSQLMTKPCLVETDNARTQNFYLKNNYKEVGHRVRMGARKMRVYLYYPDSKEE